MSEQLIKHLTKSIEIDLDDAEKVMVFFQSVKLDKKENLMEAGQVCKANYFVVKGCLRLFFITDKGVEQTTQFAIENWWLSDYLAFQNQQTTEFYIQAVERTEVLAITFHAQERLLKEFPQMEKYFRIIYQRAYGASQVRMKYEYGFSRETLYHHFNDRFPEFIQRIPQYLLASFLGFTPEYLSEIRRKKK